MLAHGINHGRSLSGTATWFESKGFGNGRLNAMAATAVEVAAGAGLILGLLTPFAAAAVIGTMLAAFWSVHRFSGFFNFRRPDEGYEYVTTLAVIAFVLGWTGPGRYSLDGALGIDTDLDGWIGVVIVASGLVLAAAQLALTWRRPNIER